MKKKRSCGSALPMAIFIMLFLVVLGSVIWSLAYNETQSAVWQAKTTQAHYLGRSGVHTGLKAMQEKLNAGNYLDMANVISGMNGQIVSSGGPNFTMTGVGTYTIEYEALDARTVKIRSLGIADGHKSTVTLTLQLGFPGTSEVNPREWVAGVNLRHGVHTGVNYLGKGVTLEGKPIQAPQGSNNASVFQASCILFTDYGGDSLVQINQCADITFDSEILYFQSGVSLNGIGPGGNKNDARFSITDAVADNRPTGRLSYSSVPAVGFEDVNRYQSFINGISGYTDYSGWYTDDPVANPTTYPFRPGEKYGVVYFGEKLSGYGPDINAGCYFYASGISLKGNNLISDHKLIPVQADDKLIPAVKSMFKYTVDASEIQMWDNK